MTSLAQCLNGKRLQNLGLFIATSTVFGLIFAGRLLINKNSDLHIHIAYARSIDSYRDISSPHFLFELIIIALSRIGPITLESATFLTLGGCYGIMAILIAREVNRRSPGLRPSGVVLLSISTLVASHVFAPTALVPNFYYGYLVPTAFHNPTQQLNKLFALAIWFLYVRVSLSPRMPAWPPLLAVWCASLCILSAVAKPSFLIAFLPTTGAMTLADIVTGRWRAVVSFAGAVVLPTIVTLGIQWWTTYGSTNSGIEFAPFAVFTDPAEFALKLPFCLALPVATTILLAASPREAPALWLAWLYLAFGLAFALMLAETGPRRLQGNFAWTAQTGVFLLYVESVLLIAARAGRDWRSCTCLGILAVHVGFGVVYAAANAMVPAERFL